MGLATHEDHVRDEEDGQEDVFHRQIPKRKCPIFKPPILMQFQVTADSNHTFYGE